MSDQGNVENVRVVVRVRPLSKKEHEKDCRNVLQVDSANNVIVINNPALELDTTPRSYKFDAVFPQDTSQADLYNIVARPIVESVIEGYHGTIFAYGQTGTGKTFTMEGNNDEPELRGIIPNSFAQLFSHIANASGDQRFLVRVSYLEIYNEDVRDLLCKDPKRLEIKERSDTGVYVKDLSSIVVRNADEMNRVLKIGNKNRSTGSTNMNLTSSRSHAIFSINVECSTESTDSKDGKDRKIRMGKLNLVDLAGSERVSKTGARLKEGAKINLSLSCLGNVISALVEAQQHIPYRSSKLTRLLQDSLGGNSKTVMCANIGPADYNYEETLGTLRYANRAKRIKNCARINEDPKDALLRQYENEIAELRRQLEEDHGAGIAAETLESLENDDDVDEEDFDEDDDENPEAGLMHTEVSNLQLRPITGNDDDVLEIKEAIESHEKLASHIGEQDQEKQQVFQELKHNVKAWKKKEEAKSNLREKLKQIKRKIMVGGENLLSKSQLQEQLLQKSMQELEHRREEESRLKSTLEAKALENAAAQEKIAKLEAYNAILSKRMKKCWRLYLKEKNNLEILTDECDSEGGSAIEDILKMSKELQFVDQILEGYIPPKVQEAIESSCTWNEDVVRWSLPCIAFSGNNIDHSSSSTSSTSRDGSHGSHHKNPHLEIASNDPELMLCPRNICNNSYRSIKSKDKDHSHPSSAAGGLQQKQHQQQNGCGALAPSSSSSAAAGASLNDDDFLSQLPKFITSTHELNFTKDGKAQIKFAGNFYV